MGRLLRRWSTDAAPPIIQLRLDYRPTPKDKERYLAHSAKRFQDLYDIAILGFETGGRLKEMRSVKMEDVHLRAVGSKTGSIHYRSADKDPSNRHVPLTDVCREMLDRRMTDLSKQAGKPLQFPLQIRQTCC